MPGAHPEVGLHLGELEGEREDDLEGRRERDGGLYITTSKYVNVIMSSAPEDVDVPFRISADAARYAKKKTRGGLT
jgi:hypothetical protein